MSSQIGLSSPSPCKDVASSTRAAEIMGLDDDAESVLLCCRCVVAGWPLVLSARDGALRSVRINADAPARGQMPTARPAATRELDRDALMQGDGGEAADPLRMAIVQLEEYFQLRRRTFDLPLAPVGTAFRQRVWAALCAIPYGETRTYGQLAATIGCTGGARAVGRACHDNPLLIVVPCHRIVGGTGALTGFAAGLAIKRQLLDLEHSGLWKCPS